MSRQASKEGFGAPKPLPGQAGYKVTESDVLAKDAKEMEMRLQLLQEKMKQQNEELEKKQQQNGGSKWKNAKPEKGSIRQYGREVTEKVKGKLDSSLLLTGKPSYNAQARTLVSSSLPNMDKPSLNTTEKPMNVEKTSNSDVPSWSIQDVAMWLESLGLSQYIESFAANEISGGELVELTLEDLDYLKVSALAHRKILFREIEAMKRRYNKGASNLPAPPRPPSSGGLGGAGAGKGRQAHWSHLEPLSQRVVSGPGGVVNSADEEGGDVFDEERERRLFQEAVREWRQEGASAEGGEGAKGKVKIVREGDFGQREREEKKEEMWVNPFAPTSVAKENTPLPLNHPGGLGLEGDLDEERERRLFQEAVREWRESRRESATSSSSKGGRGVAHSLAQLMEAEQKDVEGRLERERREAEERLQRLKREKVSLPVLSPSLEDSYEGEEESTLYPSLHSPYERREEGKTKTREREREKGEERGREEMRGAEPLVVPPSPSSVRISLLDTVLGTAAGGWGGEEGGCVIEYASDED